MGRLKLIYYFNTARYLKKKQIVYRLIYFFKKPKLIILSPITIRKWPKHWLDKSYFHSPLNKTGDFFLFQQTANLYDSTLWCSEKFNKIWLYNLHYFDSLNSGDADNNQSRLSDYIRQWLIHNPPCQGVGWEPYPISLRVVNWIKWFAKNPTLVEKNWLLSLQRQVSILFQRIEHHIMGNHLLANAKALIFAGCYFQGKQAQQWLSKGMAILHEELTEQFLADGGHFELSPMYHAALLWDLCDLVNLAECTALTALKAQKNQWLKVIRKGLVWLDAMTHPNGEISFFNDATLGIAPSLAAIQRYALDLGVEANSPPSESFFVRHLQDTGYCVVNLEKQGKAIVDIGAVGPSYQPGHAHADTLSFELSLFKQRFIVNSGISHYGKGSLRIYQRGTTAHNTVCINNQNSSQIWDNFRVAKRAKPINFSLHKDHQTVSVTCAHTGYRRLLKGHIHERNWLFTANDLLITDKIIGKKTQADAFFYFHPAIKVKKISSQAFLCFFPTGQKATMQIEGGSKVMLKSTQWYCGFGRAESNQCVVVCLKENILKTKIAWSS